VFRTLARIDTALVSSRRNLNTFARLAELIILKALKAYTSAVDQFFGSLFRANRYPFHTTAPCILTLLAAHRSLPTSSSLAISSGGRTLLVK
jgi:hypothetical protein